MIETKPAFVQIKEELDFKQKELAAYSIFERLERELELAGKKRLGQEIHKQGLELLKQFGNRKNVLIQEKEQAVAISYQVLEGEFKNLLMKTNAFQDSEKPVLYLGMEEKQEVIVIPPYEDVPYVLSLPFSEIKKERQIIAKNHDAIIKGIAADDLAKILNFLSGERERLSNGKRKAG